MKKNKTTLRKTYNKIAFLLIIILLFILIFKTLSDGLRINSLSFAGIKVDGLYLKLNEKLILDIDNIDISGISRSKDSEPISIEDIEIGVRRAIWLVSFFERLNIPNIQYANDSSSIYFDGKQYKINVPQALAVFELRDSDGDIFLDIDTLKIKQQNIDVKGSILYYKSDGVFAFDLSSYINKRDDNIINIIGQTDFTHLNVVLDTTNLDSISVLAPYIKEFDLDVYDWMYERSYYDKVKVDFAYIVINNLKSKNIQKDIVDNLYASGIVENVSLKLDSSLLPIMANKVEVLFDEGKLLFKVKDASYGGVVADSGIVELSKFLHKQTLLKLNIQSKQAILDSRILGILSYYDINLPVSQKSGYVDGYINLDILLPTKKLETKVATSGFFKIIDSTIGISGVELFIKQADLYIKDNIVAAANTYVQFKDILDSKVDLVIDTDIKQIDLVAVPTYFNINKNNSNLVDFANKAIKTKIDFSKDDIFVDFEDHNASVEISDFIKVNINDISKLLPYAPILQILDLKSGNINLMIKNANDMTMNANLYKLNYPVYGLDGNKIQSLAISGALNNGNLLLQDSSNRLNATINLTSGDILINGNNVLVDLDEMLESKIPLFANMRDENQISQDDKEPTKITINASNTLLKLFKYEFDINQGALQTTKNGFVSNARNKNGVANLKLDNKTIEIRASNFDDEFINKIFHKEIVKGGTFGLIGIYKDGKFLGDATMSNTSVTNMASLQNILTLIDAIPSLVVFKLPGFSTSGYEIDNAKIRIGINSEFIALEKIAINGSSVDIEGAGVIDLVQEDINLQLSISTMKSLSSILNKIPIFGYLLLGDDGKITTEVAVTGKIDDPKTELSLLEDTAKAPVNILKRIFSPFQLLVDELKKESQNK
ncbi:AsmA-like C-terminal domain-containing protein [Helicobacter sp. MIT 99-5507]|uniref:YhdP family protein n=1 Tax=Helicobacter sp. MIT 99-5507 TaxID=152489 RepID=UPI000E1E7D36|nr:AsmA-like C-terminal domain-containing protein [Helicobacter sp. MIT 99-5507]RDU58422.1 hypothetical protein CQA42_01125 [Helicobacter sp. MIT 99-5507]